MPSSSVVVAAGMRAASAAGRSQAAKQHVITKVFPTRSHTVSAQGGITCAIASDDPDDDWRWHMYDTVKGSDYIGDQDAIEYMCSVGPQAVFELNTWGLPFSRNGKWSNLPASFGGQSKDLERWAGCHEPVRRRTELAIALCIPFIREPKGRYNLSERMVAVIW